MAGLLDLFGGGGGGKDDDPYADILTPAQRRQMTTQGLLAMAGAFADAGMPSRLPIPFGSALGKAAAALGTGQEAGMKAAIENALAAQKVLDLRSLSQFRTQFFGDQGSLNDRVRDLITPGAAPAGRQPAAAPAGTYVGPRAPSAAPAADAPLMMDLPYPAAGGGGLLGPDIGAVGEYGTGQKATGLLGPVPPAQQAAIPLDRFGQPPPPGHKFALGPNGKVGMRALPSDQPGSGGGLLGEGSGGGSSAADLGAGGDDATPIWNPTFLQAASWTGATGGDPRGKIPVIREAAMRYGRDPDTAIRVARSEGLATFYGDGGKSGGAFQLYTGGGLGNEFQKETGLNPLDPKNEDAGIDWVMRNLDRTGWGPYHGAKLVGVGNRTGLSGSTTEGSGGGAEPDPYASLTPTPGGQPPAAPSAPPQMAPPGASQIPVPPGADPAKFNALLLELARRNAAAEVLGMGNPYGSMLSVLQGSPQYKAAIESATRGAGLPFVEPEAEAKARGGQMVDLQARAYQATLDRVTAQLKTEGEAANTIQEGGILVSDGQGGTQRIQATRKQAIMAANGLAVPELGIPGLAKPPGGGGDAGAPARGTPAGQPVLGPGEEAVIKGSAEDLFKARTVAQDAAQSIETTKEARKLLDSGIFAGAGADKVTALAKIGNALNLTGNNTKETVANTEAYFATVAGNVGRMIKQFGSGTGLSDADREYAAKMAAGQQTLDEASIRKILDINDRAGFNAINRHNTSVVGIRPGASLTPLTVPAPTPYQRVYPEGFVIENPQTGERQVRRNGNWEAMPK